MSEVSQADRARLYHGVAEHVGAEEAETLMQLLPTSQWKDMATKSDMVGLATKADLTDFATKADLANFATKADLANFATKAELAELRGEMHTGFAQLDAKIEQKFSGLIIWLVGTLVAIATIQSAVFVAFH